MGQEKKLYFNRPQLQEALVDANEVYCVWGRGTGKTSRVLSRRSARNVRLMPRSTGIIIGESYQQLLTRTLPSRIEGWEQMGLIKDVHYVIGRKPPKSWNWPAPYEAPISYDHFVSFMNGSGAHLVSQDRKGSSNGINSDWIDGDEVKLLDYPQFEDETLPTMRANRIRFRHLPFHHSITFTTSMPTAADAKWILKKREEMDNEQITLILAIQSEIIKLQNLLLTPISATKKAAILRSIRKYENEANSCRFNSLYYSEASTLENIAVLGLDYIKKMKRTMSDYTFETEILNKRPDAVEGGFYPYLNIEDQSKGGHTYINYDNSFLESLNYDFSKTASVDSRMDADCNKHLPLWIAVDWGSKINCMSVGQYNYRENTLRYINCMYVKGQILDKLAEKFIEYYKHHPNKEVNFAYDHTGNTQVANSDLTYSEQFAAILQRAGWTVIMVSKGKGAPSHQEKYLLWQRLLHDKEPNTPIVLFNKNNCKDLLVSMLQAPAKEDPRKGIQKDKSSETNTNIPQEEATHLSDTADILAQQLFTDIIRNMPVYTDI